MSNEWVRIAESFEKIYGPGAARVIEGAMGGVMGLSAAECPSDVVERLKKATRSYEGLAYEVQCAWLEGFTKLRKEVGDGS